MSTTKSLTTSEMARRKWDLMTNEEKMEHIAKMCRARYKTKRDVSAQVRKMNEARRAKRIQKTTDAQ